MSYEQFCQIFSTLIMPRFENDQASQYSVPLKLYELIPDIDFSFRSIKQVNQAKIN